MKGNYVRRIVDDYCVLDLETTGTSFAYDEIIEIGILRVRNNQVVDTYQQLINPTYEIDGFISRLTGITNDMVADCPAIEEVINDAVEFLSDDLIVGHHVSFDIRFLEQFLGKDLINKYTDTLQFSRKVFPELKHHRLKDMKIHLDLSFNSHRSLEDCLATKALYDSIKRIMGDKNLKPEDIFYKERRKTEKLSDIKPSIDELQEESYFYGKTVLFTGTLSRGTRKEVAHEVVNRGGKVVNGLNRSVDLLVVGDTTYNPSLRGKKSSKHLTAENWILEGHPIEIMDEKTFLFFMG